MEPQDASEHDELMAIALSGDRERWRTHDEQDGINLLTKAVLAGWTDVAEALLRAGYDVDARNLCGTTAIRAAVAANSTAMVAFLLRAGAAVNGTDGDDESPLDEAIRRDRVDIASILLDAGADPNHRVIPLLGPSRPRSPGMVRLLTERGWRPRP